MGDDDMGGMVTLGKVQDCMVTWGMGVVITIGIQTNHSPPMPPGSSRSIFFKLNEFFYQGKFYYLPLSFSHGTFPSDVDVPCDDRGAASYSNELLSGVW